jgi:two-component system, chemotaxis family, chemotaxis protein CheY
MTKILIIDDEIKLRETTSELLSIAGYDVVEAQDGLDGLEKVNQTNPDLIICDVMMPKLDGYGFIEQLKSTNYSNIPVLFLTAKTELMDLEKGIALGAKAYIIKPFTFKDLKRIIEHHLKYKK